jgi:hypothetical protein
MTKVIGVEAASGDGVVVDDNTIVLGQGLVLPREGSVPQQSVVLVVVESESNRVSRLTKPIKRWKLTLHCRY